MATFSPEGDRVATASIDGTARVWDAATAETLVTLPTDATSEAGAHPSASESKPNSLLDVAFSPDGKLVITSSGDGACAIWQASTGDRITKVGGHAKAVIRCLYRLDRQGEPRSRLYALSVDGTVREWDALVEDTESAVPVATLRGHEGQILSGELNHDGSLLVTTSLDGTVRLWDASVAEDANVLREHQGTVFQVAFSPNGKYLLTAGKEAARLWKRNTLRAIRKLKSGESPVLQAEFSPDGSRIVTCSRDSECRLSDLKGQLIKRLSDDDMRFGYAAFSADSRWVLATERSGDQTYAWDSEKGTLAQTFKNEDPRQRVHHASFDPEAKFVVTACGYPLYRGFDAARLLASRHR